MSTQPVPDFLALDEPPISIRPIHGKAKAIGAKRTKIAEAVSPAANNVGWAPFPGGQVQYLSCPVREIFAEGNRGGGKTELLLVKYLGEVGKHGDAWRGIIFRREYKHLEDLIAKSKRLFRRLNIKARWLSSKGDYKWVFEGGEELHFRAMKDPEDYWNYHGHEYPFIAWEELTNYPDDQCYEKMKSCNRCSVPGVPRVYHSTGNPFGAGHGWVKQRFINLGPSGTILKDPKTGMMRVRIHVDLDDNKALLAADPEYIAQLEAIDNPALRKAWREGDWNISVGGFLQGVWDHDVHIVDDFEIPRDWKRWRALDMGFAAPFSVGWYAKDPETGNIYRYRELYGWGGKPNLGTRQSPDEVAEEIVKVEARERAMGIEFRKNPADTSLWGATSQKVAGREITQAELMRQVTDDYGFGVGWIPAKKGPGSRINGAQVVVQALKNAKKGKPAGFFVTRSCRHFIRTVPILMPDPDNWEDVDTDMEDHCFIGNTKVITEEGVKPIRDLVGTQGRAWSVGGWQEYDTPTLTRKTTEIVALRFADGYTVRCTPDHRFITEGKQWIQAQHMAGQKVLLSSQTPFNRSTAGDSIVAGSTSPGSQREVSERDSTARYMSLITGLYQKGLRSIIEIKSRATTGTAILSAYLQWRTSGIMLSTEGYTILASGQEPVPRRQSGTEARKARPGMLTTTRSIFAHCIQTSAWRKIVQSAAPYTEPQSRRRPVPSIAPGDVKLLRCVSVEPAGKEDVYCMAVPSTGVFALANGLLVSNCWDEWRYSMVSHQKIFTAVDEREKGPKPGTFDWLMKYGSEEEKKQSVYRRAH